MMMGCWDETMMMRWWEVLAWKHVLRHGHPPIFSVKATGDRHIHDAAAALPARHVSRANFVLCNAL